MANPKNEWNREKNLIKILSFLEQVKEATFETIRDKIGVSQPTLTTYLKILETQNKIEHFDKSEDRRKTWYRLKAENSETVKAQVGMYEAIEFIEGLNNPIYSFTEKGSTTVSLFAEWKDVKDRAKLQKQIDDAIRHLTTIFRITSTLGDKFAIVVTKSKEDSVA